MEMLSLHVHNTTTYGRTSSIYNSCVIDKLCTRVNGGLGEYLRGSDIPSFHYCDAHRSEYGVKFHGSSAVSASLLAPHGRLLLDAPWPVSGHIFGIQVRSCLSEDK